MNSLIQNEMIRKQGHSSLKFLLSTIVLFLAMVSMLMAAPLSVQVSNIGTENGIGQANTSRNVAVAPNGDIYVVFSGSAGIRIAKSTNNGISFAPSIQLFPYAYEAEVEAAANGNIYVAWLAGSTTLFCASYNNGATYSPPTGIGPNSSGNGVHLSSYGTNVYVLERNGYRLLVNHNNGLTPFSIKVIDPVRMYSDVRANPTNGHVYVITDDPYLRLYTSYNNGISFVPFTVAPASYCNYSSYSLSVGPLGTIMFSYGTNTQAYKVNALTGNSTPIFGAGPNNNAQGRTLASDAYGNLVDGYYQSGVLKFRISYDQGVSWQPDITVATGYSHNVAINPLNHNVIAVYSDGNQVWMKTYTNLLKVPLVVTTDSYDNLSCSSVDVTGTVINEGAGTAYTRGIVYGLNPNPTTSDNYVTTGSGVGTFTENLTELCPSTTYYARAFAKDSWGNIYYGDDVSFTTETPTISLSLSPSVLWPPNHKMKDITATVATNWGDCLGNWSMAISSDEPDNGLGDGDTPNDIEYPGDDLYSFKLRAERSGTGVGRTYTVTYFAEDGCGVNYSANATVFVPHSMDKRGSYSTDYSMEVFPNPAEDFVNLDMNFVYSANAHISVSDLLGNEISSYNFNDINEIHKQIDVKNLHPGIYVINIVFGEENFVRKIVKI
ncbi:MAG: hypothetical protein A2X64_11315 [Ignavibacteria bacterium GWF2_33_9]|nr:MAG: hypothetical protein A2X64_11315 [Ignavibacteria bacterium GWF2_33_9]